MNTNGTDTITETAFYVNPALRIRHAWFKIETRIVDLLFGQYWNLYGWQPYFFPNTVDLQGLPGQVFSRTPSNCACPSGYIDATPSFPDCLSNYVCNLVYCAQC